MRPARAAALFALLGVAACSGTLPPAPPHAFVAPAPKGPPLQICWLEYTSAEQPAGYALAGSSTRKKWEVTSSGLLVRHPSGHLLIDVGTSTHFYDEIASAGFVARQYLKLGPGGVLSRKTATAALAEVGETPSQLRAVVISHVHADHAGGLMDLPGVPVLASHLELEFASKRKDRGDFAVVRQHAIELAKRGSPIAFEGGPYETFDASTDYFGDGSVVFVSLPGHTPGSLGTFLSRGAGRRVFHVGDAADSTEAIDKRRGKSFALSWTDSDGEVADVTVAKLRQLREVDPGLSFLPAHDREAWQAVFPGGPGTCVGP
jgi:glyoxylase-like metal-dependent hydrolase (beta-lactamase superfamily II)